MIYSGIAIESFIEYIMVVKELKNESWDDSDVIDEIHDEVIYQNWDDDKKNRIGIKYNQ